MYRGRIRKMRNSVKIKPLHKIKRVYMNVKTLWEKLNKTQDEETR